MGEHDVQATESTHQLRAFLRTLIDDVHALERMLDSGLIESGIRRIGAEQEMFLVDSAFEPAPVAEEVLARLSSPDFTTELAKFNLECNLSPRTLAGDTLSGMETELLEQLETVRQAAREVHAEVLLTGILPTIGKQHLGLEWMTPNPRYYALNRAMNLLRGGNFSMFIKGLDEFTTEHDNVMLESCNTSFQVHFQVGAGEFASLYNLAQVVTAPVLAAAVNSPLLLRNRLWHETRVALFQQSVDARSAAHQARGQRPRVSFGDSWVKDSVLEIFREDIARFRVVLATDVDEASMEMLDRGEIPPLSALRLHNGTVYRWNRACYGVNDGVAHLRIENRVLPAGPTVRDEIANAAFYFGLMSGIGAEFGDVTRHLAFDEAKSNFLAAARYGLKARFQWLDGRSYTAERLILDNLLPLARQGLLERNLDPADVDLYLGVLEERVSCGRTGSQWMLDSLHSMGDKGTKDERCRALTAEILAQQQIERPVHSWPLASFEPSAHWRHSYRTVGQVMRTDLFTVRAEDPVDLTASLMDWEHIRHVPVEDDEGRLVGLVTHRALIRLLTRRTQDPVPVSAIMEEEMITVTPQTTILEAIELMKKESVSCLPVIENERLAGLVTEADFMEVAFQLMRQYLSS